MRFVAGHVLWSISFGCWLCQCLNFLENE